MMAWRAFPSSSSSPALLPPPPEPESQPSMHGGRYRLSLSLSPSSSFQTHTELTGNKLEACASGGKTCRGKRRGEGGDERTDALKKGKEGRKEGDSQRKKENRVKSAFFLMHRSVLYYNEEREEVDEE